MLTCPVCSTPNPDAAVYCARCGASLPRPGQGTLPGSPADGVLTPEPRPISVPRYLSAGEVVDHKYRIESVLGEGGMGVVYLARDLNTDTRVVVKAIRSEMAHDPDLRERVRAEGRALARIDHPNVVRLNAVVIENQELYLIMQYVDGESLDRLIERHVREQRPLPLGQVIGVFRQVVAGIGAAHREGVVHRDIKPGNVLLRTRDGVAKVTDFGIAKEEEEAKAGKGKTRGIIGSLWYMAPEQVTGRRDLDKRVDIYALGILLFEMLTGRVPFDAAGDYEIMKMHVEKPMPPVASLRPDAPPWLDHILARACAKDRNQRYDSCEELLHDLEQFAPEPRSTTSLPTRPPQAPTAGSTVDDPAPPHLTSPASVPLTALPEPPPPAPPAAPRWPWAVGLLALAGAIGAAVWVTQFSDLLDTPAPPHPRPATVPSATASATSTATTPSAPARTLASLAGKWVSESGRHYQAVMVNNIVEFRVTNPADFEGQDYQLDDARFVLSETPGQPWFSVQDKMRPRGPSGTTFDPVSRGTCQIVFSSVRNEPLKAYYDGTKLRVDMVAVTPDLSHFEQRQGRVVGCNKLSTAKTEQIETTLTREPG